jgi:hypothetical protein
LSQSLIGSTNVGNRHKLEDFCIDVDDQGLGILGIFGK